MNIVITAGGTSEYIDKVRKITNSGTGKLGSIIANTILQRNDIKNIFYICSENAILPQESDKITVIKTTDTLSVKTAVEKVLTENNIDYFIHSMAISDYYVDYVTNFENIETELKDTTNINETLNNPTIKIDNTKKISSNEENLVIVLKKTPKIIGLIKKISPQTHLIGFKLLENVSVEELIDVARKLLVKNNCDYVVANDLKNIKNGEHKAFLLNDKEIKTLNGKENIASAINEIIK